jgi:hypothetical protein
MRRLKTIYAITGGEVPATTTGKKDDFNAKKSVIIAQLHNFDQVRRSIVTLCGAGAVRRCPCSGCIYNTLAAL